MRKLITSAVLVSVALSAFAAGLTPNQQRAIIDYNVCTQQAMQSNNGAGMDGALGACKFKLKQAMPTLNDVTVDKCCKAGLCQVECIASQN